MNVDDAADSPHNPHRGELHATPESGNVRAGCKIDYRGSEVTVNNVILALKGYRFETRNKNQKIDLKHANVFVYINGGAAFGALQLPNNQFVFSHEIRDALNNMHTKGRYKNLLVYMDTPFGYTFLKGELPPNMAGLAATLRGQVNSATYCPGKVEVAGKLMNTCLSTLFSAFVVEHIQKYTQSTAYNHVTLLQQIRALESAVT